MAFGHEEINWTERDLSKCTEVGEVFQSGLSLNCEFCFFATEPLLFMHLLEGD